MSASLIFRQLFDRETSTFTYLLGDKNTREALIIDPVLEQQSRDLTLIKELGLKLIYILDTHQHADHVTAASALREVTKARTVVGASAGVKCADLSIAAGGSLFIGEIKISVIDTPGHTDACLSYYAGDRVFTGDSLCIRTAGRTDFQGGGARLLYRSITEKLYHLPDETLVYPAHDYQGQTVSTIGEEKKFNTRIAEGISVERFEEIMRGLNLAPPKNMHVALPANRECGRA